MNVIIVIKFYFLQVVAIKQSTEIALVSHGDGPMLWQIVTSTRLYTD